MSERSWRWSDHDHLGYGDAVSGYINGVLYHGTMYIYDGNCGYLWMKITDEGEHYGESWVHDTHDPDADMINSKDW